MRMYVAPLIHNAVGKMQLKYTCGLFERAQICTGEKKWVGASLNLILVYRHDCMASTSRPGEYQNIRIEDRQRWTELRPYACDGRYIL